MERVVIVGPGGAGKSVLARRLGEHFGIPVIELDKLFWRPELAPTPKDAWRRIQTDMAAKPEWIMDGDLGPYDVIDPRLQRADTVIVLDLPPWTCAWRARRRSREQFDFWRWLWTWRRRSRPQLLAAIAEHADQATVEVLTSRRAIEQWLHALLLQ